METIASAECPASLMPAITAAALCRETLGESIGESLWSIRQNDCIFSAAFLTFPARALGGW